MLVNLILFCFYKICCSVNIASVVILPLLKPHFPSKMDSLYVFSIYVGTFAYSLVS
jgi:hypothetical protein